MCPGAQDLGQPGLTRQATLPADDIVWSKPPHIPGQPIPIPPRNEPHLFISVVDDIVHSKDTLAASQSNSSNGGKNDAKPNGVGSLKRERDGQPGTSNHISNLKHTNPSTGPRSDEENTFVEEHRPAKKARTDDTPNCTQKRRQMRLTRGKGQAIPSASKKPVY